MANTDLDPATLAEIDDDELQPIWWVHFDLDPADYRVNSSGETLVEGDTFSDADLEVSIRGNKLSVDMHNTNAAIGDIFLSNVTAGRPVHVWKCYVEDDGVSRTPLIQRFEGEIGSVRVGEYVRIDAERVQPRKVPRLRILPPAFNHIPPAGTRFDTGKRIVILGEDT